MTQRAARGWAARAGGAARAHCSKDSWRWAASGKADVPLDTRSAPRAEAPRHPNRRSCHARSSRYTDRVPARCGAASGRAACAWCTPASPRLSLYLSIFPGAATPHTCRPCQRCRDAAPRSRQSVGRGLRLVSGPYIFDIQPFRSLFLTKLNLQPGRCPPAHGACAAARAQPASQPSDAARKQTATQQAARRVACRRRAGAPRWAGPHHFCDRIDEPSPSEPLLRIGRGKVALRTAGSRSVPLPC